MDLPRSHDKPLFTPGPLTTSRTVKQAMLCDVGSRDRVFINAVAEVRLRLLELAGVSQEDGYECVLMQGSGTFAIEAVVSSCVPAGRKLLVVVNGAYGERIVAIAQRHGIECVVVQCTENELPSLAEIDRALTNDEEIFMVSVVHCETTSGIINPVAEIHEIAARHGRQYFVDSMSAFGAVPIEVGECGIDYLVSSANKCIEGVPGFGFAICRRAALEATAGWARTVSLDLLAQWQGLENNGQFRFTPPTHTILAFRQALAELELEGGVAGRAARYRSNYETLVRGTRAMGLQEYVPAELQGHIITSFRYPDRTKFDFGRFYKIAQRPGIPDLSRQGQRCRLLPDRKHRAAVPQ